MVALLIFMTLVVATLAVALVTLYNRRPVTELRRMSRRGDMQAHIVYEVARHGRTADVVLYAVALTLAACASVLISQTLEGFLAFSLTGIFYLILIYVYARPVRVLMPVAVFFAPYYARLLSKIRPYTTRLAGYAAKKGRGYTSDVYDMDDLIDLLKKQKDAANNRIDRTELEMAVHVLQFGNKKVRDHMVPRRVVHFVRAEEPVGPILLSELHDSGFSRFPVRKEGDEIVGTLYLRDLVEKRVSGIVSNVMSSDVFFVRDDEPLERVLSKFLRTKHHLFMVQSEFGDIVGIITIEDVIEQIMGRRIVDEDDAHDDMRAYAHDVNDNDLADTQNL